MAPPKDIARSYPKRGMTADVGFRSEPKFCGDGSVEFDGSTQGATSATSYSVASSGAKTTLACWINPRSLSGSNRTVVGNCVANATDNMALYQTGSDEMDAIVIYGSGTNIKFAMTNVDPNRWYFLAATFDFDTTTFKFYVDGIERTETPGLGYGGTGGLFEIGFRDNSGSNLQHLDGNLAHVMLIEDVLTQSEVVELMRDTSYAKAQTFGTVNRYYELDADFNDSTGSHNATSVGSPAFTVNRPQLPRGLDLTRGAAQAKVHTGRAVDFDGSTDFLDMGNGVDKNYTTRSDRASFSVWFNTDQTLAAAWIFQNRSQVLGTDRPECETQLFTHPTLGLCFDGEGASVSAPIDKITIGAWHHFVGIADDSDGPVKVYLDGVLYDTTDAALAGANGSTFVIGARNNTPIQVFNGQLSNFKIFNVELTQDQVRELYHNPETVIPAGVSASNLRRHYPLCAYNDTSGMGGRYEIDQGVEGVNGEYGGSPVMAFAQPVPCPQLGLQQSATRIHFPGATVTGSATIPALGTAASLSCWFFWDNSSRTSYPMAVGTVNSATDGLNIRIDTSGNVTTYESTDFDSGLNVTEGTWNHIVIVSQTASPYWKCFVNNTEATSPAAKSAAINITSTNAHAGTNGVNFGAAGIVADAAIWSSELSDANVAALYNSGVMGADVSQVDSSNLVAWWKCDDLTSCKDFSGNGRAMSYSTTLNAASFPENASGSTLVGDFSLKRKGVSVLNPALPNSNLGVGLTACKIPNDGTFDLDASKGFSASGFMRLQEVNVYTTIFSNTTYNTAGKRLTLGMFGGGNEFRFPDSGGTNRTLAFNPDVTDSDWHHLAATMDFSTNTVKVFLDGVLNATTTSFTLGSVSGMGDLVIGDLRPGGQHQEAAVACVKLYQVTLSENEIEQIYRSDLRLIKGLANE